MSLSLHIEKRLGSFQLRIQLEAGDETLALLGASGCGKSMTLRCIAGIERPDRGSILADGTPLFDSAARIDLSPQRRRTGLLFQNYALFPNMTVRQNILAGARRQGRGRTPAAADELMERFGLTALGAHYPSQLSGGQQQRTALARILLSAPRVLLLDEPFSALDSHLRFQMEREVREVIRQFGKTAVFVSHDRDEAFRMADQIAVLRDGTVEDFGPRARVFSRPATRTAALLTGCKNLSPLKRLGPRRVLAVDWGLELETGDAAADAAYVGVRMRDVTPGPGENAFPIEVAEAVENPGSYTVMLRPAGRKDAVPLGWELDKADWLHFQPRLHTAQATVHIPKESILLLRG